MTDRDIVSALIARRYDIGLTQAQMADRMGVARPTVARFESDALRRRTPTLFVLNRYAQAVGMTITVAEVGE